MAVKLQRLRTMHLFAGAGGGILADLLLGHQPVCAVEINEYCQQVLSARQADGTFPWFPIFADVTKLDGRPWRGVVDVVCGGFPCQDISAAGNGDGIDGERSGLWREMARIVGEVRPRYVFVENSPLLVGRGLAVVLGDLADMGYDAQWFRLSASDCGAPHQRDRCWLVANDRSRRFSGQGEREVEQQRRAEAIGASAAPGILAHADSVRELQPQGRERNERGRIGNGSDAKDMAYGHGHGHGHGHGQQRLVAQSQPRNDGRQAGLLGGAGIFPAWPADPADAPESRVGRAFDGMAEGVHVSGAIAKGGV